MNALNEVALCISRETRAADFGLEGVPLGSSPFGRPRDFFERPERDFGAFAIGQHPPNGIGERRDQLPVCRIVHAIVHGGRVTTFPAGHRLWIVL